MIGHSIAGEEMTRFAGRIPVARRQARVSRRGLRPRRRRRAAAGDLSRPAERARPPRADRRRHGDARGVRRVRPSSARREHSRVRHPRALSSTTAGAKRSRNAYQSIQPEHPNYAAVKAPALAIYAVTDSVVAARAVAAIRPRARGRVAGRGSRSRPRRPQLSRDQFRREVEHGTVLEIRGAHHWLFVSNRDEVLSGGAAVSRRQ